MPGINLSQSATQNEQTYVALGKTWFGARLLWSFILILLAASIWGGLTYYEGRLQAEINDIMISINRVKQGFSGKDVNRVADFSFRIDLFGKNLSNRVDPSKLLTALQETVLDGVVLLKYTYNHDTRMIEIGGTADSFQSLAQQLVSFRKLPDLVRLSVDSAKRNDVGAIDFSMKITLK